MEAKLVILNNILQTRVRYNHSWHNVSIEMPNKSTFVIKWYNHVLEPENDARFMCITYPVKMIDQVTTEQLRKLKKDIPDIEREILKAIL